MVSVQRRRREATPIANTVLHGIDADRHMLRLTMVGSASGLTGVIQVFSMLEMHIDRLEFSQNGTPANLIQATLLVTFTCDDRRAELLIRKLTRVMGVISVEAIHTWESGANSTQPDA